MPIELAERPLLLAHTRIDGSLDDHFGMGRHVKVHRLALDHLQRPPVKRTGDAHLIDPVRDAANRRHSEIRRRADHDGNRHRLVGSFILLKNDSGMLGRLDQQADPPGAFDHPR
jgi:hypothetical protein